MEPREQKKSRKIRPFSFYFKYSVVSFLFIISVILVACSSTSSTANTTTTTTTSNLGAPPVTVTIQFDNGLTALPTLPPYVCGAWITNTSPGYIPGSTIPVYAYFKHLVNNNPEGVAGATAQATLYLANGSSTPLAATTTGADGLAVFSFQIPNDPTIAGHNNLVTVNFTGPGGTTCTVDQSKAAYFTPMMVTPTATATQNPKKN
jgi:hypothetical protein